MGLNTLLDINSQPVMHSGVYPSILPYAAPLWQDGENVVFKNFSVAKAKGYVDAEVGTITGNIGRLAQAHFSGEDRLYICTASNWYVWNGSSLTGIGSGFTSKNWSLVPWDSWLIGTNGVDTPRVWKNTGTGASLGGIPFTTAEIFLRLENHILAFNTSNGDRKMEWCSRNSPETWTPASANTAGNLNLTELDSAIKAAQYLRNGVAIYSKDQMVFSKFLGWPYYFGRSEPLNGIGAIGKHAVVQSGQYNFGISRKGVWQTDGADFLYVDQPAIYEYIQDTLDWTAPDEVHGFFDESVNQVKWFFKTSGGRAGIGYNPENKAWHKYTQDFDTVLTQDVWDNPYGASGATVYKLNSGYNDDATAMTAWVRTKPLDLGDSEIEKIVQVIRTYLNTNTDILIRFGTMETVDGTITWHTNYYTPTNNTIDLNLTDRNESLFFVVEFRSTASDASWRTHGFRLAGQGNIGTDK